MQPPLKKVTPLFPSNPHLKTEVLSSPPFLKIWLETQPPAAERRGCPLWPNDRRSISQKNISH